jgi:uncharacterized membrane protein
MSTLVAIAYKDEATAKAALTELESLQGQQLITIDDAVIAYHQGDKIKLDQARSLTGAGALGGALWGGLFGLIFLMPVVGMAIGAASGALAGKLTDVGVDDNFAKQMAAKIGPGEVALVLLVRQATTDRVIAAMKERNLTGEIIQTNLSTEAEAKLKEQFAG